ncbi:MAG: circadian clock KaiB family protein [Pseudomonadota bacterium]
MSGDTVRLRLYIAGSSSQSRQARGNVDAMLESHAGDEAVELDVVDLRDDPEQAVKHNILAIPTLERVEPPPVRRVIGSLDDADDVWEIVTDV